MDDGALTESPSLFDTCVASAKLQEAEQQWVEAAKKEEAEQQRLSAMKSNTSSKGGGQQQKNTPSPPKLQKVKGISKVHIGRGDANVEALEARVADRRAADKLRDEKIRKKIHTIHTERVLHEAERAELKKARAEAEHRAKEAQFRRKHEEHLALETARELRCSKLKLKCDMDIIKGKKPVTARFEDRKAELKKIEEDLLIAKRQRHETCATGRNFYFDKLHDQQFTMKTKVETDAPDRTSRKLPDVPPLPVEYMKKVRDQLSVTAKVEADAMERQSRKLDIPAIRRTWLFTTAPAPSARSLNDNNATIEDKSATPHL